MTSTQDATNEKHDVPDKHEKTIIVNTRPMKWNEKVISYDQVVSLAYDGKPPSGPDWVFTVTYRKGEHPKKEGTMIKGDIVHVKDGMIFNVTATNKS